MKYNILLLYNLFTYHLNLYNHRYYDALYKKIYLYKKLYNIFFMLNI